MLSLRQLLTPVPETDMLQFLLETLDSLGFTATSWQSNSKARTLTQLVARVGSDVTYAIADIVAGGFAGLAKGPYADMVGQYMFNLARVPASPTLGVMLLTSSPAASPHTFAANELLIADSSADSARTFIVLTAGTINPGTTMPVNVQAAVSGSDSNIPPNIATLELRTALVGVSVTNPPQPPATPVNTWVTTPGADPETDGPGGRYNARMMGRWDRLTYSNTEGAYRAWVLEALPAVTRLAVAEGPADGTVVIVGATAVGGLDAGQITTIKNYLNGVTDGVGRRPINDIVTVQSANQVTTPPLGLTIYVHSPFSADAVTRVTTALQGLLGTLPIGGKRVGNSGSGFVLLADLYAAVMAQQGLANVVFSLTADVPLGQFDIYSPVPAVTMVIVP